MHRTILLLVALSILMVVAGCNNQEVATAPTSGILADHVDLEEWEMLTPCADCHREETPEIAEEWYASTHGIANVKCYQCHGTYEDMELVPSLDRCAACHEEKIDYSENAVVCWQCHPSHTFTGHK
ncbi:MAG: multiheme C-type cytochrome [bacterium]|nr:multiheme C-type cytochrome [bacterium]MCP4798941.1 multiheme C-type cytochrome [bacterium]